MSEVVSRIPFERGSAKYKNDWHESQEEQVRKQADTFFTNLLTTPSLKLL